MTSTTSPNWPLVHPILRCSSERTASRQILITGDKDFGELVYRRRQQSSGVVLLRMSGLTAQRKVAIVIEVFADRGPDFAGAFAVLTETGVRIRRQM